MDAFESVVATLLRREGYWVMSSFKVELSPDEKRSIGRHTSPRWEIDLVAYKGSTNQLLAIECKSYLDSVGVIFRDSTFDIPARYKLFTEPKLRSVVLDRMAMQLQESGACASKPKITLCLATGKIAGRTNRGGLKQHFQDNGWLLFDDEWVRERLGNTANTGYENEVAHVVAKLLRR
ncbi:MAG: hypothetical protein FD138_2451 [Planctomycetota bacterium]|nr:MAG: hypothetical protein FD138_2451 [Planctomycetota bacterium]